MFDSSKLPAAPGEYPDLDINYVERANVVVDNVSKRYVISQGRSSDASMTRVSRGKTVVDAIVNASLIALPGESIGIIGLNGSGKSTLLSMIAGGLAPTSGRILTRSQPTLMGVSPALQPDLSGEHNIYLGCLALGMSPADARAQIPEIAEWTELGEAIKRPMKTYSSGMSARSAPETCFWFRTLLRKLRITATVLSGYQRAESSLTVQQM